MVYLFYLKTCRKEELDTTGEEIQKDERKWRGNKDSKIKQKGGQNKRGNYFVSCPSVSQNNNTTG